MINLQTGVWNSLKVKDLHICDVTLANGLVEFFKKESINTLADFGCGMGEYVKIFIENNINALGFDGNPYTPQLTNNLCKVLDLSKEIKFNEPFDWVLSLEVGEHLPPHLEHIFINNLHYNNKYGIVLSWAIKGQGGDGHFNEQDNNYIKTKMSSLGYINDIENELKLRDLAKISWFKNTIMVFRKKDINNTLSLPPLYLPQIPIKQNDTLSCSRNDLDRFISKNNRLTELRSRDATKRFFK